MKQNLRASARLREPNRVVRATFSLPSSAVSEIEDLRKKLAAAGYILNRSELVRVGLAALTSLKSKEAERAIAKISRLKAGRPRTKV